MTWQEDAEVAKLRGNIEAGMRLLLKSDKALYRRAAEVGIEDLARLTTEVERLKKIVREANFDATDSDGMFPRNPLL